MCDGSGRQILTRQIRELLGGTSEARTENPATHRWAESPRANGDDLRKRKWKHAAAVRQAWSERLPRDGSEPLKTGVSDVNKEAFQGGTLHITCVGKCANPERGFVFSQTFNPTRFGERPAIHRTYIFGDTLLLLLLLLLLLCLTVHTPPLSLSWRRTRKIM